MPGRGTPHAAVRIPEDVWRRFHELALAAGTDRSALIRQFVAWYLREPGAKLPDRP
jgi:predicted transcriptional regulator